MQNNIVKRIISAFFIGFTFISSILWLPILFYILMILVAILMLAEWHRMVKSSYFYLLIGLLIVFIPITSIVLIYSYNNKYLILGYFLLIWSVDIFAMIGGKSFKGLKLAPKISPNKTWSGLITGIISSAIIVTIFNLLLEINQLPCYHNSKYVFLFSIFMGLLAQFSDLFVSYFKRKFNIKDTGNIIPGHGGVLDRFDSIIFTAPMLFLFI